MIEAGLKQKQCNDYLSVSIFLFLWLSTDTVQQEKGKSPQKYTINLSQSTIQITTVTSSEHHEHVAVPIHVLHFVKLPQLATPVMYKDSWRIKYSLVRPLICISNKKS